MKRSKKNIERNKLDYLLTDIMPVEVSELFSFSKFYEYLLSKQSTLDDIVSKMRAMKAENSETPFAGGKWGNWATSPLKFNILKGTDSIRGLNLVQPLSAMNIYFFVECYQKELLDILSNNSCFSLRYHRKNSDLFYRRKSKKIVDYFEKHRKKWIEPFCNKQELISRFISSIQYRPLRIQDYGSSAISNIITLPKLTTSPVLTVFTPTLINGVLKKILLIQKRLLTLTYTSL